MPNQYPPLKFICSGGPLDGVLKKGFAAPNPAVHRNTKEGIDIAKILESEFLLVQSYANDSKGQGRYKIAFNGSEYSATHIPSGDDIDFPVKKEESDG